MCSEFSSPPALDETNLSSPLPSSRPTFPYLLTASRLSASLSSSPPDITLLIYAALRASDAFHTLHSRYPGLLPPSSSPDADEHDPVLLEKDAEELEGLARKIVGGWKGEERWEGLPTDEVTGESGEERVWKKLGEVCREMCVAFFPAFPLSLSNHVPNSSLFLLTQPLLRYLTSPLIFPSPPPSPPPATTASAPLQPRPSRKHPPSSAG